MNIGPLLNIDACVYVLLDDDDYLTAHRSHAYDDALDNLDLLVDAEVEHRGWYPALMEIPRADLGENEWGAPARRFSWTLDASAIEGRRRVVVVCEHEGAFLSEKRFSRNGVAVVEPASGWIPDEVEAARHDLQEALFRVAVPLSPLTAEGEPGR